MRPLRVLYSFPDTLGDPGIGTTALRQVNGLIALGLDVDVYCTSFREPVPGAGRRAATLAVAGRRVPHRALGVNRAYDYHDRRVARALRHRRDPVDVVHAWPLACRHTFVAARAAGVPTVREVPNTHTEHAYERVAAETRALGLQPPAGHSHSFDAARLAREEAEYALVDRLLVPSEFAADTFLARGFPANRLAVHRYGADLERFSPASEAPRDEPFTVVFVGRCEPRKGLHHALRAWVQSGVAERGRFQIYGDFVPGYREALEPWLCHPSIAIEGFVSDTATAMRAAHALVLPSVEEGSALVTYEAQACGCVLVVSDAVGARCEHERHGLIHVAGDVDALAEHFRRLDGDRQYLGALRAATLAHRDELGWERAAEELVEAYERCLDVDRPSARSALTWPRATAGR